MRKIVGLLVLVVMCACSKQKVDLSQFHIAEDNLVIDLVAQEPSIVAPVAIDFDKKGRLWVAEMPDYMPDINGEGESISRGRIVILEDSNGDGTMDQSRVFLDKIHHLRTIKLYRDGILYADNPNLYFAKIVNDKPISTIIIDSTYASGGNIEHKPNGLLLNVDNCFYSAKSNYRYCFYNEQWHKESTNFRGQWGITNDENGRLYTNDNSNLFFGDQFLPNTLIKNKYQHQHEGLNVDLVGDRSIFPIQSTAVNRGYLDGHLDEDGRVLKTTSACGPYIFQDGNLGSEYNENAFVCIPEANLIKRLKIDQDNFKPKASFFYENAEFITSTDEAFRPVNITIGPDGNLYIVDFHRGIIQHKIYMTKYLRNQIIERKLDRIYDYGRILRVRNKDKTLSKRKFNFASEDSLVHYLTSKNTWLRTKAQEVIIPLNSPTIDEKLYKLISKEDKLGQIHGLWALAGRKKIDLKRIQKFKISDPWVISNLLKIASDERHDISTKDLLELVNTYKEVVEPIVQNHLLTSISGLYSTHKSQHSSIIANSKEALLSAQIAAYPSGTKINLTDPVILEYNTNVTEGKVNSIYDSPKAQGSEGYDLYNTNCASCHGFDGKGIQGLAPSLEGGELINSTVQSVPLIILNGLSGPLTINGQTQNFPAVMPAFNLTALEIEKISNYIYNAFSNEVKSISSEEVDELMTKFSNREEMWTEGELIRTDY